MRVNTKKSCSACYCNSCRGECTCFCNTAMEQDANKYSLCNLRSYSYRYLQQMAKSMNLPSNVKKMYLVELINTKKFKSPRELNEMIQRVKRERKQQAMDRKTKKDRVQGAEISSTSNSSPPITRTPKRHGYIVKRSPGNTKTVKYNTEQKAFNTLKVYPPPLKSDRVLRSFRDRPNYRILNNNNTVIGVIKVQSPKTTKINIISRGSNLPKFNVTAIVKKQNAEVHKDGQLMPYPGTLPTPSPRRRQRKISGISPLTTPERPRIFTPTVNFTRRDGRTSKINALVHKPVTQSNRKENYTYKMDDKMSTQTILTEYDSVNQMIQGKIENAYGVGEKNQDVRETVMDNEYYHKKIRAEHVRSVKVTQVCAVEERLPCINDVFSKFSDVNMRRMMQPIHVEVSTESERTLNFPPYVRNTNSLLESLYNLKSELLTNQPLLQVAPAANTKCVFSTHTVTSTMQQPATMILNEYNPPFPQDNPYEAISTTSRINDYLRAAENEPFRRMFTCDEVLSSSPSSLNSSRELGASVTTIPEMVEDAFELISQDGDYMERIGMEDRMKCFICTWAGPKFILEHHIRKEHASDILCAESGSCRVQFSLGALAGGEAGQVGGEGGQAGGEGAWTRRVMSRGGRLLVLSAIYEDPHHLMAALHTLTDDDTSKFGKITIYNKVSGEPYVWEGEIKEIPDSISREDNFRLDLSKMNLLPNSANLMLINRELVVMSPSKVVVGSPALHDIHIELFIQLWG